MERIGLIGLGHMGAPMACRLLETGHRLTVWNRTTARAEALAAAGADVAATPAALAASADVVITMVRDAAALTSVVFDRGGLGEGLGPASLLVDMSTIGVGAVHELRAALSAEVPLVDAPVLGSIDEARSGTLTIFVGAEDRLHERVVPVLTALGTPIRVGALGAGAAAKLVANSALLAVVSALAEGLALGVVLGLDEEDLYAVLATTPLSAQAEKRRRAVAAGAYPGRFALTLARKDADLIVEAGARQGLKLQVAAAARDLLADADHGGWGDRDYSAVLGWLLERARRARGAA